MKDLTFGEQVKIILSRKGMTIKELAERIQEETGKAMSRQNLTQRLGRDNFQEQDMRMIAAILGCPFRLSIFPTENDEEFNIDTESVLNYAKKSAKKKKEDSEEVYQQQLVFDETLTASVAEEPVREVPEKVAAEVAAEEIPEEVMEAEPVEKVPEEAVIEEVLEEEAPVEEAVEEEIPEEVMEAEPVEEVPVEEAAAEEIPEEVMEAAPVEEILEEVVEEAAPVQEAAEDQDITIGEFYEMQKEPIEEIEDPEPVKQDRFRTGSIFLRGFGRNKKKNKKAEKKAEPVEEVKPVVEKKPRPVITPDSEDFEPVYMHVDAEEDLTLGEMNPYTGREYQSNSVRMHPTRIGYVQVYDRSKHGWEDMTEWAFLGYQEQKKAMLGRDYEPPIYLD